MSERSTVPDAPPPERIWMPLPYAGVCSTVNRSDLPQQEYIRADIAARSEGEAAIDYKKYATDYEKEFSSWIDDGSKVYNLGDCAIQIWHNIIEPLRAKVKQLEASASAPATEVERALAETVALCPNSDVEVTARAASWSPEYTHTGDERVEEVEPRRYDKPLYRIEIDGKGFSGASLTEAMQSVREWRAKEKE